MEVPPTALPESVASMRTSARAGTPSSVTGDCPSTAALPQSSPADAVGTPLKPPKPNIIARHSILRRQSLQSVTHRLYEAAKFAASIGTSTAYQQRSSNVDHLGASTIDHLGASTIDHPGVSTIDHPEASNVDHPGTSIDAAINPNTTPSGKRTRKRRRHTCCTDSICCTPAAETPVCVQSKAPTPVAVAGIQSKSFSLHPSLHVSLQFDMVFTRMTNAVNHLADIATTRASKLCVMRETYSQQDADSLVGHALNADVDTELEIVSELSNIASDLTRLQHLWTTATEYCLVPYEAISLSVSQLIHDAQDASTDEAYRIANNEAAKHATGPFTVQKSERRNRKNTPHKLPSDDPNMPNEFGELTAQSEEEYGDAAANLDNRQ